VKSISAYIDRFEGDYAVLLVGAQEEKVNFPRHLLPEGVGEGDYLALTLAYDAGKNEAAAHEAAALRQHS